MKYAGRHSQRTHTFCCSAVLRLGGAAAAAVLALLLCAGLFVHAARAEIDATLLELGSDWRRLPPIEGDERREFRINGARFWLHAHSVQEPLNSVLRRYEERCVEVNTEVFSALGSASDELVGRAAKLLASIATSSAEQSDRGYVACVDFADSTGRALLQRLSNLSHSDRMQSLGSLHYVYLERDTTRPEQETFVLSVGGRLDSLIRGLVHAVHGDVAGADLPSFPRPPGMQRILSAWEVNGPSGVFSYVSKTRSPAELESFYRELLPQRGWKPLERHRNESLRIGQIRMLSAEKSQRLVSVIAHSAADARTVLTILVSEPP